MKSRKSLGHDVFDTVATQDGHVYDITVNCLFINEEQKKTGSSSYVFNTVATHNGHVYDITAKFLFTNGQQKKIGS